MDATDLSSIWQESIDNNFLKKVKDFTGGTSGIMAVIIGQKWQMINNNNDDDNNNNRTSNYINKIWLYYNHI